MICKKLILVLAMDSNQEDSQFYQMNLTTLLKTVCCQKCQIIRIGTVTGCSCSEDSEEEFELSLMPIQQIHDLKTQYSHLVPKSSRCSETFSGKDEEILIYDERYFCEKPKTSNCQDQGSEKESKVEEKGSDFPSYADVTYGTSIRQQKELFNRNIEEIRKKMNVSIPNSNMSPGQDKMKAENHKSRKKRTCEEIAMKLAETLQEVEDLKIELETCEQRLDSKYKAINILRKQAEEAQKQLKLTEMSSKETTLKLSQVNVAGGGNSDRVTSLVVQPDQDLGDLSTQLLKQRRHTDRVKDDSKPKTVPIEKYTRKCQENKSLMKTLELKMEDLRKVTAQKMAVDRENDELLALLDIQERAKYEKTRSVSSEENYCSFSSTELAVLGACRCRISSPEPCGCAHAAANLKKEIVKMKEELHLYKSRRDEAYHTVDAYRKAFEEQLQRNKSLTLQLANISTGRNSTGNLSGTSKAKLALKWLIGSLNDEDVPDDASSMVPGPAMSEYELITYLTEMLNEKKEVLAHQKLASQILADRVKVLEDKLSRYEKDDSEVFT
ncbi:coiled-coil domain-containing protein 125-like isoform X1 [Mercenaria mercenaria]|uniref:coiled-coil domain-containing protein 125-like isoform X1 n=1 Tax=Mercenaria mercenaria TaxID=6596 RepID=UPI00234F9DB4|nr:coiled-coil domain-containing protein 125-like isoform X1 [Mercenaria mercenaria]